MSQKREVYERGIAWIALNDDPGSPYAENVDEVQGMISVALLADLFSKQTYNVAMSVVQYRKRQRKGDKE